jgi:hypothetical protein
MPERPVTPFDCALAVALPLSGEELRAELESDHPSDFAAGIRARFSKTAMDRVFNDYDEEVAAAGRVLDQARSAGVTVVRRAGLADLARLTERFHVVSVLAHSPSPGIVAGDILDPVLFSDLARSGALPDQKRARRHLRLRGVDLGPPAVPCASAVASVLDALLWTRAPAATPRRGRLDRTRVEDAFPGAIRPGPVIELSDGLHSIGAVRGAIARSFDGVLDLSTCTSIVLAEALKRVRDDFLVVATVRTTHPRMRLLLYELHVQELALVRRPVLFTHVVRVVADALAIAARR